MAESVRDALFPLQLVIWQGILSFLLVLHVGPALVSTDLRNNGLPLYLARPFSRGEYVIGKLAVLVILISAITWVPGLLLFFFQSYMMGWVWFSQNLRMGLALFAGFMAVFFGDARCQLVFHWLHTLLMFQSDRRKSLDNFRVMLRNVVLLGRIVLQLVELGTFVLDSLGSQPVAAPRDEMRLPGSNSNCIQLLFAPIKHGVARAGFRAS